MPGGILFIEYEKVKAIMAKKILYQSTNRELNKGRIKGFREKVPFKEALFMGQAPDKGLFMPTVIPEISKKEILKLRGEPYHTVAYKIINKFLSGEIEDNELKAMTERAYPFDIPFERLDSDIFVVRLDKGPTGSFKDFAARIMAQLMHKFKPEHRKITVLVATSGDTGSAIGEAYKGLEGIKTYLLYPAQEVSPIQKKQLDSIGKNVKSIAVDGKFDDCQNLVKEAFADSGLKDLNLTSANSINIGRILPQIAYYFFSYINIINRMQPVIFSIPSGNLGNSLSCELARRMGLPVKKIIIATNENDEFPRFLKSGVYQKIEPSLKCISNAMNVGNPSNLARYFDLYGGILDKDGIVYRSLDRQEMNRRLYSVAINDEETVKTIRNIFKKYHLVIEPHGAVGIAALMKFFEKNEKILSICMETAHPAKFPDIIKRELNISLPLPDFMRRISRRTGRPDCLPNDYRQFKEYLLNRV